MKLICCPSCWDVFKLAKEERTCSCGRCSGRYLNNTYAETNGEGINLAIGNGSLLQAAYNLDHFAKDAERHEFIDHNPVICWVRPPEGPGNPHTTVRKEES